ncbi:MAG: 3-methyl-2-oxobutanoate dehydrogenase subunit beta [Theionarchaea archaeon]|nr:3-methyl-2-oxobutanoate dehydrogenase subunit beta [Theionarchaea archaeon]MBU7000787.1 3-methyl-2-oxobutanoate dehydrogenase subunit beta [Theionarchaea archaeon]MBU7021430.1 3-methyl-2-oxobutanoate dehydrogenase subunit beta [Theionarchaea archaeon]MBU7033628.1 3-methyl-2-oxobutanoate dehydrogenase subunit beta [Theionarchaea archaeon]MBU7041556.1 3-methyl-2-oxobutanoate dehydrogenase subunit beta [Theionarchaea archaeon]
MMRATIPEEEYMFPGTVDCQGCGAAYAMRLALKALGPQTMVVIPACCWSIIAGPFPTSALKMPIYHTAFETAAAVASGLKAGLNIRERDATVLAWAGDGGTFDIGVQALSAAAERDEDIIYVCYDNEAYMNTGIQRSSATPWGAWTTTTPRKHPKDRPKKNMMEIMAAHKIPYVASATVGHPEDFVRKLKKAKEIRGTRFFHVLATCPTGWRSPPELMLELPRLAVETRVFPLYEIENGVYSINRKPKQNIPVAEYLKVQGRFRHLTDQQIQYIQDHVDETWELLLKKEKLGRLF